MSAPFEPLDDEPHTNSPEDVGFTSVAIASRSVAVGPKPKVYMAPEQARETLDRQRAEQFKFSWLNGVDP